MAGLSVISVVLSGCASWFFPDFEEPKETVVEDGGKVQEYTIEKKGILISDRENVSYENDSDEVKNVVEEVVVEKLPAREVVPVEAEKLENDTVKTVDGNFEGDMSAEIKPVMPAHPSMHYLAETIYFDNGGATISSEYIKDLKNVAKIAKEHQATVSVYGFASSRTRDMDPASHKLANFKVSSDRAENTAKLLRRYGVKDDQITVRAFSDTMPVYQEVMPEGERLNRRVEIYLTY
ncbi:MAG: OmpA family protein [Alphaproteobacteria bacterium]|nr:OmpA family protein [Alphaproteobacteria bacterium]